MYDNLETAYLKISWKRQIIMTIKDGEPYVFNAQGVDHNTYVFEHKKGKVLVEFHPIFDWQKFHYSYDVFPNKTIEDVLVALIDACALN